MRKNPPCQPLGLILKRTQSGLTNDPNCPFFCKHQAPARPQLGKQSARGLVPALYCPPLWGTGCRAVCISPTFTISMVPAQLPCFPSLLAGLSEWHPFSKSQLQQLSFFPMLRSLKNIFQNSLFLLSKAHPNPYFYIPMSHCSSHFVA